MTEQELTAHEILAQHTTNVSAITAKAMNNAILEYGRLRALLDDLARERTRELLRTREPAEPEVKVSAALESVTEALATLAEVIAKAKEFMRIAVERNRLGVVPDAKAARLIMNGYPEGEEARSVMTEPGRNGAR